MMKEVMGQFNIDALHFGIMASFYYYGYAGAQIPVAILLDKYGARYIVFACALLCGIATLIFTYSQNYYLAVFSRFLIGVGSAVGFLGVSKVLSEWFPKEQYSRMVGFTFTIGLTGAIYGGKPISLLIEQYSWHKVALCLALISISIGVISGLLLKSPKETRNQGGEKPFELANFTTILSSPIIWMLALSNLLMVGTLEGFADVWGVQYLMTAYNISKADAAGMTSLIFFGMLFGGPILAFLSQRIGNYPVIALCGFGMSAAFALLLFSQEYNSYFLSSLFFVVGILCCYQVIVFAAGAELTSTGNLGVTIAFLNCINMLGGSFFHTIIGGVMDLFWAGELNGEGLRVYGLFAFKYALGLVPLSAAAGAILACLVAIKALKPR
jgi:MFS family permease